MRPIKAGRLERRGLVAKLVDCLERDTASVEKSREQIEPGNYEDELASKFIGRVGVEDTCVPQRARVHRAGYGLWPSSLPGRYLPAG